MDSSDAGAAEEVGFDGSEQGYGEAEDDFVAFEEEDIEDVEVQIVVEGVHEDREEPRQRENGQIDSEGF